MASTVSNGNDRSEKWQRPFTKGKFASQIEEKDLQRKRSRLKSIKTKFFQKFHNKTIRFVLTKPRVMLLRRSVCMLFVSTESCGCEMHCTWTFIVTKLSNMLNNSGRGLLGHLTAVPHEMSGMHFKKAKCRCISKFGIFYRDQLKCVNFILYRSTKMCFFVFLVQYIAPFTKTLHFIFNVTGRCFNCNGSGHLARECPPSRWRAKRNKVAKDSGCPP